MILGENFGWLSSGSIYRSSFSKEYQLVINLGAKNRVKSRGGSYLCSIKYFSRMIGAMNYTITERYITSNVTVFASSRTIYKFASGSNFS